MTTPTLFSGFDGLMNLSRREGVDIRPTLLRVLADLYVQTNSHSEQEARQFVELTSRLIDQVDDATRAAVRARLAVYPATPAPVLTQLGLKPSVPGQHGPMERDMPALSIPEAPPVTNATRPSILQVSVWPTPVVIGVTAALGCPAASDSSGEWAASISTVYNLDAISVPSSRGACKVLI